jgi:NitT/TauT family transport system substrate-binding protein
MIGPLLKGDADAIVSWEPHAGRALRGLAGNGVRFSLAGVYEETYDLVTSVTMSRDNSATVAKVLRALDRAVTYMNANRVESVDIVARRIGMEKSELDPLWGVYTFGLDLRPALTELLRAEGEWAVEQGYQKPPVPEMSRLIAPDALRMAKPAAVQLP